MKITLPKFGGVIFLFYICTHKTKQNKIMARKVFVNLTVKVVIDAEEGIDINEVLSDMDYNFTSNTDNAEIVDTEIIEQIITDSK